MNQYNDNIDDDNELEEDSSNDILKKKEELNDRLPPQKQGIVRGLFNKFLRGKGIKGFAGLKIKLTIAAIVVVAALFIFLIIVGAYLLAQGDDTSKAAVSTRKSGVSSLGINEQSSKQDQKALSSYEENDSLLGFSTNQLNQIYTEMLKDNSTMSKYLQQSGNKKIGELDVMAALITGNYDTAFSINGKRTLYEHILRTEKYNFNTINWHQIGHNVPDTEQQTEYIVDRELVVPKGTDDDKLALLMDLTSPYLLTNNIPFGMLSGLIANSTSNSATEEAGFSEKFVYQVLKETLTKMTVYKYGVSKVKVGTAFEEYTRVPMQQTITLKLNGDNVIVSSAASPVQTGDGTPVKTDETRYKDDEFSSEDYWYVTHAKTFDNEIINEYEYKQYSDADYHNLVNPNSNNLVNTESIDRIIGSKYNSGDVYMSLAKFLTTQTDDFITALFNEGYVTIQIDYQEEIGQKKYYEKEWTDKLTSKKCEVKALTYSDIIEYNTKQDDEFKNIITDKRIVSEEEFKYDESANKDYERYQEEDKSNYLYGLNMIDFLNSNPGIYNKYLFNESARYSEFKGVDRNALKEGYRQVRNILNTLSDRLSGQDETSYTNTYFAYTGEETNRKKIPFVYGSSLGYDVVSVTPTSSGSSSLSGMALLKAYLRSREGHEGIADENGNKLANSAMDQATYYIVGEVWNGSKYTRTVGYGVDLDTSGYEGEIMAAVGTTSKFQKGDLIPIEIVDKCEEDEISKAIADVEAEFAGIELKEYQMHALVSRYYNCGCGGWKWGKYSNSGKTITQAYNEWWKEEEDDQYESLLEQYKDNESAKNEIVSHADYNNGFYTDYMKFPTNGGILVTRRESEWILFSMGYYDSLQKFWTNGGGTPGGINLYNNDGSINEEACAELTNWFVDNFFSGDARMRFNGMGGWEKTAVNGYGVSLNTAEHPFLNNGLQVYQCTWWARVRASYQAWMMDPENLNNYIKTSGNGCQVAKNTADHYKVNLNMNVEEIKPNSIVSFNEFTAEYPDAGHVAYVEAVDYEAKVFYVSHCGGGHSWYGITKKNFSNYSGGNSGKFGGSVSVEDIVNSDVYKGGNK